MAVEPLRIGLFLDTLTQPKWVERAIAAVASSPAADVTLVIVGNARSESPAPRGLLAFHERLDKRRHRAADDPLAPVDLSSRLAAVPQLHVSLGGGTLTAEAAERIEGERLDVILSFGAPLTGDLLDAPRLGVWSYDFSVRSRDGYVAEPRLVRETPGGLEVLYRSPTGTHDTSPARNRPNVYYKAAAFAARAIRDAAFTEANRVERANPPARPPEAPAQKPRPALAEIVRTAGRIIANRVNGRLNRDQWVIGVHMHEGGEPNGPAMEFERFRLIEPPPDRFWADPFPLVHEGRNYVFFEDYPYATRKGHLAAVEIDGDGNAGPAMEVMNTDFHLSFPNVFHHDGALCMLPETSAVRQVGLYRCDRFPDRWSLDTVLLDNIAALDPVVFQRDGRWWMFVGTREEGTTGSDELSLFHAPDLRGPWSPHARNPVRSTVFGARPAGRVYTSGGALYRPGQDCSRRYGYGLSINRVDRVTPGEYSETEVLHFRPEEYGFIGLHTINHNRRFTAADFLRRTRRPRSR